MSFNSDPWDKLKMKEFCENRKWNILSSVSILQAVYFTKFLESTYIFKSILEHLDSLRGSETSPCFGSGQWKLLPPILS